MSKKVLVVASEPPFPANHGLRVDIASRLRAFPSLSVNVTLLYCNPVGMPVGREEIGDLSVRSIEVDRKGGLSPLISLRPYQVVTRSALADVHIDEFFDVTIIEGANCLHVLENKSLKTNRVILRVHNDEGKYLRHLARSTSNPIKKAYRLIEAAKLERHQKRFANKVDEFWFISSSELTSYKFAPSKTRRFLPPTVGHISPPKPHNPHGYILFIGALFMDNNIDGIVWYLDNVHAELFKSTGQRLVVAGNSRGQGKQIAIRLNIANRPGVDLVLDPKTLDELYNGALLFLNPMRFGAGLKLKGIDALANGVPVVSTECGTEGTGLKQGCDFLLFNDNLTCKSAISRLTNDPPFHQSMIMSAQHRLVELYSTDKLNTMLWGKGE